MKSVMNTIPIIFNEKITPYTAVGCKERTASTGITAVILNRPGYARRLFFQDIEKTGFDNVISIESCAPHYDIEELSNRFPFVRFILPEKELNLGEQINLAAREAESPLFYVMRSDMKIVAGGTAKRMAERLIISGASNETQGAAASNPEEKNEKIKQIPNVKKCEIKRLCTIPVLMNSNYEVLPSIIIPLTKKKKMSTHFMEPCSEGDLSLYPFDGIGIYDRQRFIMTGGYDATLKNSHWQLMDFGFRAHLWGEEITLNLHFKLSCDGELQSENYSIDENYKRYFLKNLAPVFKNDYAHLPYYRFLEFLNKSGDDLFSALDEFKLARNWVKMNKYRYKSDARSVISRFETAGEALRAKSE
ncbi:MAG: hypothetical protein FWC21_06935 [Treponema sp.]|nr:hypothetical protein [Treponema sp.]